MIEIASIASKEKIMRRRYLGKKEGQVYVDNGSTFTYVDL